MPVLVPTQAEFDALAARVAALEGVTVAGQDKFAAGAVRHGKH